MRRPPAHEGGPGVAIGARRTHAMEDIEARRRTHGRRRRLEAQPASGSRAARTRENVTGRERKREREGRGQKKAVQGVQQPAWRHRSRRPSLLQGHIDAT